jgi:hypothetical protein
MSRRSIVIDTKGTESTRDEWMKCLRAHIKRAAAAKAAETEA